MMQRLRRQYNFRKLSLTGDEIDVKSDGTIEGTSVEVGDIKRQVVRMIIVIDSNSNCAYVELEALTE